MAPVREGMVPPAPPVGVRLCPMDGHRKLRVWQDAHLLVLEVYAVTKGAAAGRAIRDGLSAAAGRMVHPEQHR
jgi:hypothetical protein